MAQSSAMDTLRQNIRRLLAARGWTQGQLATKANIPRPNLNRILHGEEKVTIDRAERIAKAFRIPLSQLLSDDLEILAISA